MLVYGNASSGQLGLGGIEDNSIYFARWNKHVKDRHILEVGCGLKHTLLLVEEGKVLSCGSNEKGQLGQDQSVTRPGIISSLDKHVISQVSCGYHHSLALTNKGKVFSWGDGQYGQLGLGPDDMEPMFIPREVPVCKGEEVVQIACGAHHNLALLKDGCVFSWGLNNHRQLALESGKESSVSVPTLVSSMLSIPVQQLSAGCAHSVVVSRGGAAFSWGRNSYGQLGIGTSKDQLNPCLISSLSSADQMVRYAACGEEHTLLLSEDGHVYSCGFGTHGQLGHGTTNNLDIPKMVRMLDGINICQISCGRMHSSVISMPDGDVFMFGQGSCGQVGVKSTRSLVIPVEINLGPPPDAQMTQEVSEMLEKKKEEEEKEHKEDGKKEGNGSSIDSGPKNSAHETWSLEDGDVVDGDEEDHAFFPPKLPVHLVYAPQRVFCGGNQTFVLVIVVTTNDSIAAPGSCRRRKGPLPVDIRIVNETRIPLYLTKRYLIEDLRIGTDKQASFSSVLKLMDKIFSSAACLNGSFMSVANKKPVSETNYNLDLIEVCDVIDLLRQKLVPVGGHSGDARMDILFQFMHMMPSCAPSADNTLEKAMEENLLPKYPLKPCGLEGLRSFLFLPFFFMKSSKRELVHLYMNKMLELERHRINVIMGWFFKISHDYARSILSCVQQTMIIPIRAVFEKLPIAPNEAIENVRAGEVEILKTALRFLRTLHEMNSKCKEGITYDQWHVSDLTEVIDLSEDYFAWLANESGKRGIVWCNYPFLLDTKAKSILLHVDCGLNMKLAVTQAYTHNFHRMFSGQSLSDMSPNYFVLTVNRENLVDSTVSQLVQSDQNNFKKPLRIQFIGEEGEDVGGVAKEFFMLLSQRILSPDFGMFLEVEDSHFSWFQDGELFYEKLDYYLIIGILCGLAIYNAVTVYLPFPIALYKKLLDKQPSFNDFKEMYPMIGKGIQEIMDYNGDEFEKEFDLNFTITRQMLGEIKVKELVVGGAHVPVTMSNRIFYCNQYVNYFLTDAIREQFKAFKEGFMRVCTGRVLKLLHPQELMSLVVGEQVENWEEMKKCTEYKNGYTVDHECIKFFWEIFNSFSKDEKGKFLVFLTGTNRIPIQGFKYMKICIQRMDGGHSCERLPVAHTCFNILDLPAYPTKTMMKEKLAQAIQLTSGFGLV